MDSVLRPVTIYFFLLLALRVSGKRSMATVTTFDFVLLLIIGESTQQALIGNDFSITGAVVIISTLITVDIGMSYLKRFFPMLDRMVEGLPMVLIDDGQILQDRMKQARVDEEDILQAARQLQGLHRMELIRYAILERSGGITIIPKQ